MRFRLLAAAAASVALVAATTPAGHAASPAVGRADTAALGPFVVPCGYSQICTGAYVAVANYIVFTCESLTPYYVDTTSVGCYLHDRATGTRYYAQSTNIPGLVGATYEARTAYFVGPYELCIAAAYNSLVTTNTACLTFP